MEVESLDSVISAYNEIVAEACERYTNIEAAFQYVRKRMYATVGMAESLVDYHIMRSLRQSIHDRRHSVRTSIKRPESKLPPRDAKAVTAAVEARKSILDSWVTEFGRPLGDLFTEEVAILIEREGKSAQGHLLNKAFYQSIHDLMPAKTKVRRCVTGEQADQLMKDAVNGVSPKKKHKAA